MLIDCVHQISPCKAYEPPLSRFKTSASGIIFFILFTVNVGDKIIILYKLYILRNRFHSNIHDMSYSFQLCSHVHPTRRQLTLLNTSCNHPKLFTFLRSKGTCAPQVLSQIQRTFGPSSPQQENRAPHIFTETSKQKKDFCFQKKVE